jgi:hypothetical protein
MDVGTLEDLDQGGLEGVRGAPFGARWVRDERWVRDGCAVGCAGCAPGCAGFGGVREKAPVRSGVPLIWVGARSGARAPSRTQI